MALNQETITKVVNVFEFRNFVQICLFIFLLGLFSNSLLFSRKNIEVRGWQTASSADNGYIAFSTFGNDDLGGMRCFFSFLLGKCYLLNENECYLYFRLVDAFEVFLFCVLDALKEQGCWSKRK